MRLIKPVQALLIAIAMLACFHSYAQEKIITGTIYDEQGAPLSNATVSVKGDKKSVATDSSGSFRLQVPPGAKTLTVSYVGMQQQEVSIEGKNSVNVILQGAENKLNEVVVVGYGTTRKSDLTGSVATLKGGALNKTPSSSVDQLLQGKIPGVQVITAGGAARCRSYHPHPGRQFTKWFQRPAGGSGRLPVG